MGFLRPSGEKELTQETPGTSKEKKTDTIEWQQDEIENSTPNSEEQGKLRKITEKEKEEEKRMEYE